MSVKGRALLHCPVLSNVDLLRYGEGIVHINVTKQKLDGAQIPGAPIDQCRREEHASCEAMSAFRVAIRGKADMTFALQMSAYDPKRTLTCGIFRSPLDRVVLGLSYSKGGP